MWRCNMIKTQRSEKVNGNKTGIHDNQPPKGNQIDFVWRTESPIPTAIGIQDDMDIHDVTAS